MDRRLLVVLLAIAALACWLIALLAVTGLVTTTHGDAWLIGGFVAFGGMLVAERV